MYIYRNFTRYISLHGMKTISLIKIWLWILKLVSKSNHFNTLFRLILKEHGVNPSPPPKKKKNLMHDLTKANWAALSSRHLWKTTRSFLIDNISLSSNEMKLKSIIAKRIYSLKKRERYLRLKLLTYKEHKKIRDIFYHNFENIPL